MTNETKPFGQLSRDEKHNIVTAWLGGEAVYVLSPLQGKWKRLGRVVGWYDHLIYRKAEGCA